MDLPPSGEGVFSNFHGSIHFMAMVEDGKRGFEMACRPPRTVPDDCSFPHAARRDLEPQGNCRSATRPRSSTGSAKFEEAASVVLGVGRARA